MVAMSEELGLEMTIRSLEHLLQYGEQNIRRAVPLALALLCISNPKVCFLKSIHTIDFYFHTFSFTSFGCVNFLVLPLLLTSRGRPVFPFLLLVSLGNILCCLGQVNVMDTLSRLSHDSDTEVAMVILDECSYLCGY